MRAKRSQTMGVLLAAWLACTAACASGTTPSPASGLSKYGANAVPLSRDSGYFRRAGAADFWALMPYYVPQHNDRACSLASLSMVVNAARRSVELGADGALVTQVSLEASVHSSLWSRGLAPGGAGVTLDQLGALTRRSLTVFQRRVRRVDVVHVNEASQSSLEALRQRLVQNESSADDFLLFNFEVEAYTGVGDYGHIAPVGAYDAEARRVLILDPDRTWYEPYWIPDEVALRGMATRDTVSGQPRGYVHVWVEP